MASPFVVLSDEDVARALPMCEAIDELRLALQHAGEFLVPERLVISCPEHHGSTLFKPAVRRSTTDPREGSMGIKIVSVRPDNAALRLPAVPATVMLFDKTTGLPRALMAATHLTGLRTAACSAIAIDALRCATQKNDPLEPLSVVVFGAGLQAELHVAALRAIGSISSLTLVNRTGDSVRRLAEKLASFCSNITALALDEEEAVMLALSKANTVITATNSQTPLFAGTALRPGTVIAAVGSYTPAARELDETTIRRCRAIVLDEQSAMRVGEFALGYQPPMTHVYELSSLCVPGWTLSQHAEESGDIYLYKSVGSALQDLASGAAVLERAVAMKLGTTAML
eukprot:m.8985 g.8985  ORF g.8985 m.8985 type:complete len:342 (+) comp5322_c0_seq1:48-1073(+)